MTHSFDGHPLHPRAGGVLRALVIARISTAHQDERSLDDQADLCRRYVRDRYPGPVEFTVVSGRGSGELLDRQDLADAEAAVASGRLDLVVVEDLGRVCRRNRAIDFCEQCEDAGTRLVAINDALDTARPDWRLNALFASFKHESGNKDTAARIRRSLRHRFAQGGVVQTLPFGYVKPPGARSDADVRKDPAAAPAYEMMFSLLEGGASYAEVADRLNAAGHPTGRWARRREWDGRMVARVVRNPVVKGFRRRNARVSRRVNRTGRRASVKAPPGEVLLRHAPHLAFVDPARYDRLVAALDARHASCARGRRAGAPDGRAGVPKRRTAWPGQHLRCGVCGRLFYWGGHGQPGRMMCSGARDYRCWNAATCDGREAGRRLAGAVLAAAEGLPEFDAAFRAEVDAATAAERSARSAEVRRAEEGLARADRELANLVEAVASGGFSPALGNRLAEAEGRAAALRAGLADLLARPGDAPPLPPVGELRARARAAVGRLAFGDPGFGREMAALVPEVRVLPYRPLDGGAVVLRAHAAVTLAPLLGPGGGAAAALVTVARAVDLFDPPQRVAYLGRVADLVAAGSTFKRAGRALGLTATAAQRAGALGRRMAAAGAADPYVPVTGPPAGGGRFARHAHRRYRFDPLPGYPAWPAPAA